MTHKPLVSTIAAIASAAGAALLPPTAAAAAIDVRALWDFAHPDVSEQRFRDAMNGASADDALILQTQIARTYGLRNRMDEARALLQSVKPKLEGASPEARVRWHLEWGRTWASAVHDRETLPDADRQTARAAFRAAATEARMAGLDALAVDALHMLPFTTADRAQDLAWNEEALAMALASTQPDARRWAAILRNNIGVTYNDMGRHEDALAILELALQELQAQQAPVYRQRIGRWMVANTLRRLGRTGEALTMQRALETENDADGTPDPYVFDELALLYRARGDAQRADAAEARARAERAKGGG